MSIHVFEMKNRREVCDACGTIKARGIQLEVRHDSGFADGEECPGHPVTVCWYCLPEVLGLLIRADEKRPRLKVPE